MFDLFPDIFVNSPIASLDIKVLLFVCQGVVGDTGFEPARTRHGSLNAARLPITPIPHIGDRLSLFAVSKHYLAVWVGGFVRAPPYTEPFANWAGGQSWS